MTVLTDTDLLKMLETDSTVLKCDTKLVIHPYSESSLTPIGYDLRVGTFYKSSTNEYAEKIEDDDEDKKIVLAPRSTTNIRTLEWIAMPQNKTCCGLICSKVSKVAKGLSHISTTIDPDWAGQLSISVHNHTDRKIDLKVGEPFCTAVFLRNESPATRSCGFGSGRADILVRSITSRERRSLFWKRCMLVSIIVATLFAVWLGAYKLYLDFASDNNTKAMIATTLMVVAFVITQLLAPLLTRLIYK